MAKEGATRDAVTILRDRYVKDDVERKASVEQEHVNAQVAQLIHDLRIEAGLTQAELAELVGTTQSAISRLENSDYEGHSLSMLSRIAKAFKQRLSVTMTAEDAQVRTMRYAFHLLVQLLRRQHGLTVDTLARETGIDRDEIVAMERNPGYTPTPLTIRKLSAHYGIPEHRMLILSGVIAEVPDEFAEEVSRFATEPESFVKLTREEKKALDRFMTVLQNDS